MPAGGGRYSNDSRVRAHSNNLGSRRSPRQTFCGLTGTSEKTRTAHSGRPAFHHSRVNAAIILTLRLCSTTPNPWATLKRTRRLKALGGPHIRCWLAALTRAGYQSAGGQHLVLDLR